MENIMQDSVLYLCFILLLHDIGNFKCGFLDSLIVFFFFVLKLITQMVT
jgi:hypothetical protein